MSTLTEVKEALPRLSEAERYDLLPDLAAAVPNIVKRLRCAVARPAL